MELKELSQCSIDSEIKRDKLGLIYHFDDYFEEEGKEREEEEEKEIDEERFVSEFENESLKNDNNFCYSLLFNLTGEKDSSLSFINDVDNINYNLSLIGSLDNKSFHSLLNEIYKYPPNSIRKIFDCFVYLFYSKLNKNRIKKKEIEDKRKREEKEKKENNDKSYNNKGVLGIKVQKEEKQLLIMFEKIVLILKAWTLNFHRLDICFEEKEKEEREKGKEIMEVKSEEEFIGILYEVINTFSEEEEEVKTKILEYCLSILLNLIYNNKRVSEVFDAIYLRVTESLSSSSPLPFWSVLSNKLLLKYSGKRNRIISVVCCIIMKCGSSSSSLSYISPVLIPKCINKVKENKERIKEKEESFSEGLMKGLYNVLVDVNTSERTLRKCLGAIYTVAHDVYLNIVINDSSIPENILRILKKDERMHSSVIKMLLYALFSITLPLPVLPTYDVYTRSLSDISSSSSSSASSSMDNNNDKDKDKEVNNEDPVVNSKYKYTGFESKKEKLFDGDIVVTLMKLAEIYLKGDRSLAMICYSVLYNLSQYPNKIPKLMTDNILNLSSVLKNINEEIVNKHRSIYIPIHSEPNSWSSKQKDDDLSKGIMTNTEVKVFTIKMKEDMEKYLKQRNVEVEDIICLHISNIIMSLSTVSSTHQYFNQNDVVSSLFSVLSMFATNPLHQIEWHIAFPNSHPYEKDDEDENNEEEKEDSNSSSCNNEYNKINGPLGNKHYIVFYDKSYGDVFTSSYQLSLSDDIPVSILLLHNVLATISNITLSKTIEDTILNNDDYIDVFFKLVDPICEHCPSLMKYITVIFKHLINRDRESYGVSFVKKGVIQSLFKGLKSILPQSSFDNKKDKEEEEDKEEDNDEDSIMKEDKKKNSYSSDHYYESLDELLECCPDEYKVDLSCIINIGTLLSQLSRIKEGKESVYRNGGIELFVQVLNCFGYDKDIVDRYAVCMSNTFNTKEITIGFMLRGTELDPEINAGYEEVEEDAKVVTPPQAKQLLSTLMNLCKSRKEDTETLERIMSCLIGLPVHPTINNMFLEENVIDVLIPLLLNTCESGSSLARRGSMVLNNLSRSSECSMRIAKCGGIDLIQKIITHYSDESEVLIKCCNVIVNISRDFDINSQISSTDIPETIINLFDRLVNKKLEDYEPQIKAVEEDLKKKATKGKGNGNKTFTMTKEQRESILKQEITWDQTLIENVIACLVNFTSNQKNCKNLCKLGLCEKLVRLIGTEIYNMLKQQGYSEEDKEVVFPPFEPLNLIFDISIGAVQYATLTLTNITIIQEINEYVSEGKVIPLLKSLIYTIPLNLLSLIDEEMSIRESLLGINEEKDRKSEDIIEKADVILNNPQSLELFKSNRSKKIDDFESKVRILIPGVMALTNISLKTIYHKELIEVDLINTLLDLSKSLHNIEDNENKLREKIQNDKDPDFISLQKQLKPYPSFDLSKIAIHMLTIMYSLSLDKDVCECLMNKDVINLLSEIKNSNPPFSKDIMNKLAPSREYDDSFYFCDEFSNCDSMLDEAKILADLIYNQIQHRNKYD